MTPQPSFSKRRITLPERHLRDAATSAGRILERWPRFAAACTAMTPAALRAGAGSGVRTSDISDPTGNIVVARARHDELADKVYGLWHQARWLAMHHLQAHGAHRATPTGQLEATVIYCEQLAARWDHLTTDEDSVATAKALLAEAYVIEDTIAEVLKSTRRSTAARADYCLCGDFVAPGRKGMCIACYWKDYRAPLDSATSNLIETRERHEPRPVEPTAPSATTFTCMTCLTDYCIPYNVDPVTALEQHRAGCG